MVQTAEERIKELEEDLEEARSSCLDLGKIIKDLSDVNLKLSAKVSKLDSKNKELKTRLLEAKEVF